MPDAHAGELVNAGTWWALPLGAGTEDTAEKGACPLSGEPGLPGDMCSTKLRGPRQDIVDVQCHVAKGVAVQASELLGTRRRAQQGTETAQPPRMESGDRGCVSPIQGPIPSDLLLRPLRSRWPKESEVEAGKGRGVFLSGLFFNFSYAK